MNSALGSIVVFALSCIVSWGIYVFFDKKYMISKKLSKVLLGRYKVKSFIWLIIIVIIMLIIALLSIFLVKISENVFLIIIGGIATVGKKVDNDLKYSDGI